MISPTFAKGTCGFRTLALQGIPPNIHKHHLYLFWKVRFCCLKGPHLQNQFISHLFLKIRWYLHCRNMLKVIRTGQKGIYHLKGFEGHT